MCSSDPNMYPLFFGPQTPVLQIKKGKVGGFSGRNTNMVKSGSPEPACHCGQDFRLLYIVSPQGVTRTPHQHGLWNISLAKRDFCPPCAGLEDGIAETRGHASSSCWRGSDRTRESLQRPRCQFLDQCLRGWGSRPREDSGCTRRSSPP